MEQETDINANVRIYEIGVQIIPIVGDAGSLETFSRLQGLITERGGQVFATGEPVRIDLAYTMYTVVDNKKVAYNEAYFAWFKFELDAVYAKEVEKILQNDSELVRSIMFKTVRVATYIQRKQIRRRPVGDRSADEFISDELAVDSDDVEPEVEKIADDVEVDESALDQKLTELSATITE